MLDQLATDVERIFSFGPFRLLPTQRLLLENDQPVRIGSRALDILIKLLERPGELVSKEELTARVWPSTVVVEANLTVQITALRRALHDGNGGNRYLLNVPGRGYCFVAPVTVGDAPMSSMPSLGVHEWNRPLPPSLSRLFRPDDDCAGDSKPPYHHRGASFPIVDPPSAVRNGAGENGRHHSALTAESLLAAAAAQTREFAEAEELLISTAERSIRNGVPRVPLADLALIAIILQRGVKALEFVRTLLGGGTDGLAGTRPGGSESLVPPEQLTRREREVLGLIGLRRSNEERARSLARERPAMTVALRGLQ